MSRGFDRKKDNDREGLIGCIRGALSDYLCDRRVKKIEKKIIKESEEKLSEYKKDARVFSSCLEYSVKEKYDEENLKKQDLKNHIIRDRNYDTRINSAEISINSFLNKLSQTYAKIEEEEQKLKDMKNNLK